MSLIDYNSLEEAQRQAQRYTDNVTQRTDMRQSMDRIAADSQRMFDRVWSRGSREEIQAYLDTFSLSEQQQMFTCHAATMTLLATYYPEFHPQMPPYESSWSETGIVIGDLRTP